VMLEAMNSVLSSRVVNLNLRKWGEGYVLDLSGTPYYHYRLRIIGGKQMNVLHPFGQFRKLDISNSAIMSMNELAGIRVRHLQMSGLNLTHPDALDERMKYFPSLRAVTVDLDTYPPEVREYLNRHYKVNIVKKAD